MTLWFKPGVRPQDLPGMAVEPDGTTWTDLANNPAARAATGWQEAPDKPAFDPVVQALEWNEAGPAWTVISIVPLSVSALQATLELLDRGIYTTVANAVAASLDPALQIYWLRATDFHRDHPEIIRIATAFGWTAGYTDELFIAAAART